MPDPLPWLLWLLAAYLAGSIPFGLLLGLTRGVDIRKHGSGNVGATNCGRVLGRRWGILCFVLDVFKGLLPVLLYGVLVHPTQGAAPVVSTLMWLGVAAAGVLGHVFPVWLRFRGGKGVATGLGVLLGFWPVLTVPGLVVGVIWLGITKRTGYVGLASVVAALCLPPLVAGSAMYFLRSRPEMLVYVAVTALLAGLVVWRHRKNIANLRAGTEPRVAWARRG